MGVFLTLHLGQMCFRRPEAKLLLTTWLNHYRSCLPLHHWVMGQGGVRRAVLCRFCISFAYLGLSDHCRNNRVILQNVHNFILQNQGNKKN